jgi:hypothetical protein
MLNNMYIMPKILHQSDTYSLSLCKFPYFSFCPLLNLLAYRTKNKIRVCHLNTVPLYKIERKKKMHLKGMERHILLWIMEKVSLLHNIQNLNKSQLVHITCKLNNCRQQDLLATGQRIGDKVPSKQRSEGISLSAPVLMSHIYCEVLCFITNSFHGDG